MDTEPTKAFTASGQTKTPISLEPLLLSMLLFVKQILMLLELQDHLVPDLIETFMALDPLRSQMLMNPLRPHKLLDPPIIPHTLDKLRPLAAESTNTTHVAESTKISIDTEST